VLITPFDNKVCNDIVKIHKDVLGYTFNSLLGYEHLSFIYQIMANSPNCYVGVAHDSNKPLGVVSGTLDTEETKRLLQKNLSLKVAGRILGGIIKKPVLLRELKNSLLVSRPVVYDGKKVDATLTAIAVSKDCQGQGVGKSLVMALEDYFISKNIYTYRLDTLVGNHKARGFYRSMGFDEVNIIAGSVILVKRIKN
jgi:ribosomal protein S18 acetylase RimI-like enzyme